MGGSEGGGVGKRGLRRGEGRGEAWGWRGGGGKAEAWSGAGGGAVGGRRAPAGRRWVPAAASPSARWRGPGFKPLPFPGFAVMGGPKRNKGNALKGGGGGGLKSLSEEGQPEVR